MVENAAKATKFLRPIESCQYIQESQDDDDTTIL